MFGEPRFRTSRYVFRGQADAAWSLRSSFDRWYEAHAFTGKRHEVARRLLDSFVSETFDAEIGPTLRSDETVALAVAQHHGLPTRLLDWTRSPYVAAFFAFLSHLDAVDEDKNPVAIWVLNLDSEVWGKDNGVEVIPAPHFGHSRIRNQDGLFTISRTPHSTLEEYVAHFSVDEPPLTQALLPAQDAPDALADLSAMGIDAARLFPGIEGAAFGAKCSLLLERLRN
jgi:hypothetical protein